MEMRHARMEDERCRDWRPSLGSGWRTTFFCREASFLHTVPCSNWTHSPPHGKKHHSSTAFRNSSKSAPSQKHCFASLVFRELHPNYNYYCITAISIKIINIVMMIIIIIITATAAASTSVKLLEFFFFSLSILLLRYAANSALPSATWNLRQLNRLSFKMLGFGFCWDLCETSWKFCWPMVHPSVWLETICSQAVGCVFFHFCGSLLLPCGAPVGLHVVGWDGDPNCWRSCLDTARAMSPSPWILQWFWFWDQDAGRRVMPCTTFGGP